jgi:MFS family permease
MFKPPYNYRLLVIWWIFVIFGFWDTFVTTFLIDYIDEILKESAEDVRKFDPFNIFTAYVFIALFCIPAYGWQVPLVKIANKFGPWKIMVPWLLLAWISMFVFWLSNWIYMVLLAWLMNWLGYASCMPTSQWEFSNEYNITYSNKNNLKQIDANASSAPTKMLSNLANVIWLALGWLMLEIFWYMWTFFFLGIILIWLFVISVWKRKEFKLY